MEKSQDPKLLESEPPAQTPQRGSEWWWLVSALAGGFVAAAILLALLSHLARPLGLVILAVAVAMALSPLVHWLERRIPRAVAAVLVFIVILLILGGLGTIIAPALVAQVQTFLQRMPGYTSLAHGWLSQLNILDADLVFNNLTAEIGALTTSLLILPVRMISFIISLFLIFFIALYWVILAPSMMSFFLSLFPKAQRGEVSRVMESIGAVMGGYFRGALINGLIVGLLTFLGLLVIGVEYPLILGIFTAVMELIPIIGPFIAGVLIVITALLQSPAQAIFAGLYILVMQQMESHILVPNIIGRQTNISPLLALLAVFFGGVLGGLVGALAAIPLAAALQVVVVEVIAPALRQLKGTR